jgi:hypothetical protein
LPPALEAEGELIEAEPEGEGDDAPPMPSVAPANTGAMEEASSVRPSLPAQASEPPPMQTASMGSGPTASAPPTASTASAPPTASTASAAPSASTGSVATGASTPTVSPASAHVAKLIELWRKASDGAASFRSARPKWVVPAGIGVSMLIVGFVMGRLTAPTPASQSNTVSEHAAAAAAAPPAANEAPSPPANAPEVSANQPEPEPAENPTMAADQGNTSPYKGGRLAGPVRPGSAARRGEPAAVPPSTSQPVDPLVQAVKQSITEDQGRQKSH